MFSSLLRKSITKQPTSFSSSLYLRNLGLRRLQSTTTNGIKHAKPPQEPKGIKKLMKQYGYSALGVYLAISIIDIPICFVVVHSAGEDKIRELQDKFLTWIGYKKENQPTTESDESGETQKEEEKSSTLVTEFALAYAIHKSLILVRLSVTAAITPWIVARLQRMGFKIGKMASNEIKRAAQQAQRSKNFDPTGKSSNL